MTNVVFVPQMMLLSLLFESSYDKLVFAVRSENYGRMLRNR